METSICIPIVFPRILPGCPAGFPATSAGSDPAAEVQEAKLKVRGDVMGSFEGFVYKNVCLRVRNHDQSCIYIYTHTYIKKKNIRIYIYIYIHT